MERTPYPMSVDTSDWQAFGTSEHDASCDRERIAFTHFFAKRVGKLERSGRDAKDAAVGAVHAIVQIVFAAADFRPTEEARQAMHQSLDFAWLQVEAMARDIDERQAS